MKGIHLSTLIGLAVAGFCGYWLHQLLHGTSTDRALVWALFAGVAVGLFFASPAVMKDLLTTARETVVIVVNATPLGSIKWGKRAEDVPIAVAPPGVEPGDPVKPTQEP